MKELIRRRLLFRCDPATFQIAQTFHTFTFQLRFPGTIPPSFSSSPSENCFRFITSASTVPSYLKTQADLRSTNVKEGLSTSLLYSSFFSDTPSYQSLWGMRSTSSLLSRGLTCSFIFATLQCQLCTQVNLQGLKGSLKNTARGRGTKSVATLNIPVGIRGWVTFLSSASLTYSWAEKSISGCRLIGAFSRITVVVPIHMHERQIDLLTEVCDLRYNRWQRALSLLGLDLCHDTSHFLGI